MATAGDILLSNSNINGGTSVTTALHLLSSQKYIEAINLSVEDSATNIVVKTDDIVASCIDDDIVQVEITDISVNAKDIINVNKEI